jgi:hypothetical protein
METQRNSILLRQLVLGALFTAALCKPRPALGYTMVVWGDLGGWGCIGACGGDGYDPIEDWSGGGDGGGGGGGGGGAEVDVGTAEWPLDIPARASGSCSPPSTRSARASEALRRYVLFEYPDMTTCEFNLLRGQYFFIRFEEDHLGSSYQWTGSCRLDDPTPNFLTEKSSQCPSN